MERMNSTLKKMLTKDLLSLLQAGVEEGKDFEQFLFTCRNWVEELHKLAKAYNHTPKALTKVTPMEVHFPGRKEEAAEFFLLNSTDERILRPTLLV